MNLDGRKIAIIRRNGLGDLLCAFPLILYLRERFPSSKITLFVDPYNQPLLSYLPSLEEVVILPKKGNKYLSLFQVAKQYRGQFDCAISGKTSPMKLLNIFLYLLGAKERMAYVDTSWHCLLINRPTLYNAATAQQEHQALKSLHLVAPQLSEIPKHLYPKIEISDELKKKYVLAKVAVHPILLITATTTNPMSRLSVHRYAELLNALYDRFPFTLLIVAQNADKSRAISIGEKIRAPYSIHVPQNFDEFMVLLDRGDFYFVGDGGVAHIGAALGKKMVVLYGGVSPIQWRPMTATAQTLFHPEHVDKISDSEIVNSVEDLLSTN